MSFHGQLGDIRDPVRSTILQHLGVEPTTLPQLLKRAIAHSYLLYDNGIVSGCWIQFWCQQCAYHTFVITLVRVQLISAKLQQAFPSLASYIQ